MTSLPSNSPRFHHLQKESSPARERRILDFWKHKKIFFQSIEQRKNGPLFSAYDGPPFATGLPHYGHLLTGTIKDAVLRYYTMQGYYVPRNFGWDCHGLPVENEIEKTKGLTGVSAIETFGIGPFNEECRNVVLRYTQEWEETVARMGRWVDFAHSYRTMDREYMESVWWTFAQLFSQGLVYEGFKVMPFSAALGTPLSNFEANLNYKEVDDPSLTLIFPLVDEENSALLIWTTTPWTLPANLAVMASPCIEYVKILEKSSQRSYILSSARLHIYFPDPNRYTLVRRYTGKELYGKRYLPPFSYYLRQREAKAFRIILEQSISEEEGTGLVHCAPAFGEVDFFACSNEGIELVCPIDQNGKFTDEIPEYRGQFVKDADREIIRRLKSEKRLFHQGTIRHRYPFCWRSDSPLLYKAVRTWFVAVEKVKDRLLAANEQIRWVPGHIKAGRFGKWLENARDWAISRNRYWGTPLPIWRNEEGSLQVIASVAELEKLTGERIEDLHRHYIDRLTFEINGKTYHRVPEVFDCWFESGAMPYAQYHYPFAQENNSTQVPRGFPADFIAEGLDQTRGWFYTLTVLAAALYNQPAFKNVIVNGIILAEDGTKMSKRLKNYPEPNVVIEQYGADAVRLYLLMSNAVLGEDLRFSEKGVEQVARQVILPLWNAYSFLATYAEIYQWKPRAEEILHHPSADIDRWILSLTMKLQSAVQSAMDNYELQPAAGSLVKFIEELTNWYIRRSRTRFWADEESLDRNEAFETLYSALFYFIRIAAPLIPFISEAIYLELKTSSMPLSLHLLDFPQYKPAWRDEVLEQEMAFAQNVVSVAHSLRKAHKLKVRQPLRAAYLIASDATKLALLRGQKQLIADELNVKEIIFHAEEKQFVQLKGKVNFPVLGKRAGARIQAARAVIENLSSQDLESLIERKSLQVLLENEPYILTPEDVLIERVPLEGVATAFVEEIAIVLDTTLDEALLLEGLAREIINKINTARRDQGYLVTDRICVEMQPTPLLCKCLEEHREYVVGEVLASSFLLDPSVEGDELDVNGEKTTLSIRKFQS
jgi:isoleucyl-tRNA synthetase